MKKLFKCTFGAAIAALSRAATNGPGWMRATAAFMLSRIDPRRRITAGHVRFQMHVSSPIERWRADTVLTKEPETIAWLDRTIAAESVFYDVGANVGLYSLYAANLFPGAVRAVCFEPEPMNFARLNQNIAANGLSERMIAYPVGLGAERRFDIMPLSVLESGGALHGAASIEDGAAAHVVGVSIWPLDDVLAAASELPRPTHLKIDVDGPELAVVTGAKAMLGDPALRHVLIEVTAAERGTIEAALAGAGFEVTAQGAEHDGMFNLIFEKRS